MSKAIGTEKLAKITQDGPQQYSSDEKAGVYSKREERVCIYIPDTVRAVTVKRLAFGALQKKGLLE